MSSLLIERRGGVTHFILNRPAVHNNVDAGLAMELSDAIDAFAADARASVLVVSGAGGVTWCAGANLKGMKELFEHRVTRSAGPMGFCRLDPGKPVIAAINGNCWAGGVEFACWCDFRIVDENAKFGLLNKRWGLSLADGGTQRLARTVGLGNALYMIETGMEIDAHNAYRMGLAQEVVPAGTAVERALAIAGHICTYGQDGIRADRKAAILGYGMPLPQALELEADLCYQPAVADEAMAGMARFAKGSRPEPPRPVHVKAR
ncbi:MAG TPA: enoyl-CoA hydratase-related protein [Burkholderiaceae bacterium]|nr:enoyl-CoA hydratase-related protein [Burkholderiaceae bacterium]